MILTQVEMIYNLLPTDCKRLAHMQARNAQNPACSSLDWQS